MPTEDDTKTDDKADKPDAGTLTQADVDKIVNERLKRERAKYADYDDLKAKAEAADKAGEKDKSEVAQLTSQMEKLNKDLADERRQRHIVEVAASKGLTPAHAKRLTGSTREEIEASADELLEDFPIPAKADPDTEPGKDDAGDTGKTPPATKPREQLKPGSGDPDDGVEVTDPRKLAEAIPR